MQATGRRDTAPELALRRELHRRGLRYRVQVRLPELPRRRMDIVFKGARVVVLVDGCFWHGCSVHGTTAQANAAYWSAKLQANRLRDRDTDARLAAAGWAVVRVWEHELPDSAASRVHATVTTWTTRNHPSDGPSQELPETSEPSSGSKRYLPLTFEGPTC